MNTDPRDLYLLLYEWGSADAPLEAVAERYLGLDAKSARAKANRGDLPFPAYRAGSQKAPWLVRIADIADWRARVAADARAEWERRQVA